MPGGRSLQYPTTTARKCGLNYDALHSQQYTLQDHPWHHIYEVVENADRAVCAQRKNDLDRQYQIALIFSCFLVPVILDSYRLVFNQSSYIASMLCPDGHPPFLPYRTAVIINALWFSSLLLTGSTLMISCLCRRCFQEFMNRPQFDAKHLLAFRQMRYNSLRIYRISGFCDSVHSMTLLATILSLSGLIVLLQALDHPDFHIVVGTSSVILLFLSLFGRRGLSSPPFNCQLSWLFFKRSRQGSERSTYRGLSLPLLKPISLRTLVPQALASRDWLEQDCFNFFHPNNIDAIDLFLADALVWIDSSPTIEETLELVVSIYLCISDFESPNIFASLDYGPRVAQHGLAAIFHEVANKQRLDDYDARALASKLWLKIHFERMPHRSGVASHAEANMHGSLEPAHFSINLACRLLTLARNRLASGRYLIGTFEIVRLLMTDKQNAAAKDVQQAIFAVLDECRLYFKTGEYKNHYHQAQLCVDELDDLIRAGKEPGISLPHYWAGILGRAVDVHGMAGDIMTGPSSEQVG